jgi:hypothetical protein
VIGEVSMVTSWLRNRTPLTLRPISDHVETDLCSKKIVRVGSFLHLTRVAKGFSISVLHRLITWISCWNSIRGFYLHTQVRIDLPQAGLSVRTVAFDPSQATDGGGWLLVTLSASAKPNLLFLALPFNQ